MQVMCFMDVPGPSNFPVGCPVACRRAGQNEDGAASLRALAAWSVLGARSNAGACGDRGFAGDRSGKAGRRPHFGAETGAHPSAAGYWRVETNAETKG